MKYVLTFLCITLIGVNSLTAQALAKPLTIGDSFPMAQLAQWIGVPNSKLRSKALLLQFWSPNCGQYNRNFYKLQFLHKKWGQNLFIVGVTSHDSALVQSRLNAMKTEKPTFPLLCKDKELGEMFPHKEEPYVVWVDYGGRVRYLTGIDEVSDVGVEKFLSGIAMGWLPKSEPPYFDVSQPLWQEGNGRFHKNVQHYSYFLDSLPGINPLAKLPAHGEQSESLGVKIVNEPLAYYYYLAATENGNSGVPDRRYVVWNVSAKDSLLLKQVISYESWTKDGTVQQAYKTLRRDLLERYPFRYTVKNAWVNCYVLKKKSIQVATTPAKGQSALLIYDLQQTKVKILLREVELHFKLALPLVNETGSDDLQINLALYDPLQTIKDLNRQLSAHGLHLAQETRFINAVVIERE